MEPILAQPNFEILEMLALGPDSQLDLQICKRLKSLRGKTRDEVIVELREIIGDCINGGLCSGFVLKILQFEYKNLTGEMITGQVRSEKLDIPK